MRIRKEMEDSGESMEFLARIADALSHPARIMIFQYVKSRNSVNNHVCNGDLVNLLDYSQSTISQHVKKMVQAGLFNIEKREKNSIYSINQDTMDKYLELLQSM